MNQSVSPESTASRNATVLERAIARGQCGELEPGATLWILAASSVVVVNDGVPPAEDFPPSPLVVSREGTSYVAVFTHQEMAGAQSDGRVAVLVPSFELLRRIPPGVGLVVNPGNKLGLEVPPDGLRGFVQMLLNTSIES